MPRCAPSSCLGGRYQAVRILKEADGTQTLLANDLETQRAGGHQDAPEAQRFRQGTRMRLEQECRQLCELHSMDQPPLLDIGTEGNLPVPRDAVCRRRVA